MRFLVDACMDVRVASWLRSQGHDATHLRDEGLERLPNGKIFVKAAAEQRVIVKRPLEDVQHVALVIRGSAGDQRHPGDAPSSIACLNER